MNRARLRDTLWVREFKGRNRSGDPIFAPGRYVKAFVEAKTEILVSPDGNETQASHRIFTAARIPQDARVWLPGTDRSDDAQAKRPLSYSSTANLARTARVHEVKL